MTDTDRKTAAIRRHIDDILAVLDDRDAEAVGTVLRTAFGMVVPAGAALEPKTVARVAERAAVLVNAVGNTAAWVCRAFTGDVLEPAVAEEPAACPSWWKGTHGEALRCEGPAGHNGGHGRTDEMGRARVWWGDATDDVGPHRRCDACRLVDHQSWQCSQPSGHSGPHRDDAGTTWVD